MRLFVLAALLAGSLAGIGHAEEPVCNEPWARPGHPPVHPPPCHERPECETEDDCDDVLDELRKLLEGSDG